jgi:hypothetical protein
MQCMTVFLFIRFPRKVLRLNIISYLQNIITLRTINNVQKVQGENHQLAQIGWFGSRTCRKGEERSAGAAREREGSGVTGERGNRGASTTIAINSYRLQTARNEREKRHGFPQ